MLPTDSNGLRWSNRSQGILTGRQLSPSITPAKGNHRKLVRTPRTRLKPDCVVFLRVSNLRLPTPALLRMPTAVSSWLSPLTPISLSRRQPVFCNLCSNFNPCFPGSPNSVLLLSKTGGTNIFNVDIIGMQIVCHLLLKTVRVRSINDCATPWLPHSTEQENVREFFFIQMLAAGNGWEWMQFSIINNKGNGPSENNVRPYPRMFSLSETA